VFLCTIDAAYSECVCYCEIELIGTKTELTVCLSKDVKKTVNANNISWITSAEEEIGTFFINRPSSTGQASSNRLVSYRILVL